MVFTIFDPHGIIGTRYEGGDGCSPKGGDCMTTLELIALLNLLFTVIFKVIDYIKK